MPFLLFMTYAVAAAGAKDFAGKQDNTPRGGRPFIAGEYRLRPVEHFGRDNGGAIIRYVVTGALIRRIAEHTPNPDIGYDGAEFLIHLAGNGVCGVPGEYVLEDEFDNGAFLFDDNQVLVLYLIPQRIPAAQLLTFPQHTLMDVFDAVACLIRFILGNGEFKVQHKTAVRGRGVIVFLRTLPVHAVLVEYVLHFVEVPDATEPAVEALQQDNVNLSRPHVIEKTLEPFTPVNGFAGRTALIGVHIYNSVMVLACVFFQVMLLLGQGKAVLGLLIGGYSNI